MTAIHFQSAGDFRDWLAANDEGESEILVGYYKVSTGKASMTWPESTRYVINLGEYPDPESVAVL